jgi:hypothetical protein
VCQPTPRITIPRFTELLRSVAFGVPHYCRAALSVVSNDTLPYSSSLLIASFGAADDSTRRCSFGCSCSSDSTDRRTSRCAFRSAAIIRLRPTDDGASYPTEFLLLGYASMAPPGGKGGRITLPWRS